MVRKGSPVRVRQRALESRLHRAAFSLLGVVRTALRSLRGPLLGRTLGGADNFRPSPGKGRTRSEVQPVDPSKRMGCASRPPPASVARTRFRRPCQTSSMSCSRPRRQSRSSARERSPRTRPASFIATGMRSSATRRGTRAGQAPAAHRPHERRPHTHAGDRADDRSDDVDDRHRLERVERRA
jgi:hypothetical protein